MSFSFDFHAGNPQHAKDILTQAVPPLPRHIIDHVHEAIDGLPDGDGPVHVVLHGHQCTKDARGGSNVTMSVRRLDLRVPR